MIAEILLLVIAGLSNAVMDRSALNQLESKFWNKGQGWTLKYKNTIDPPHTYWWYLGLYKPQYQERFPFSTTILVSITDGWHLMQFIMLTCFQLLLTLNVEFLNIVGFWGEVFELLIAKTLFSGVFQIMYSHLNTSKND